MRSEFRDFVDSPFTWGAIGMLAGAVTSVIPLATFFMIAWMIFTVSVFRAALSNTSRMFLRILVGAACSIVLSAVLWGTYRVVPKPPTMADMAVEILNRVPGLSAALAQFHNPVGPVKAQIPEQPSSLFQRFKPPTASEIADEVVKKISAPSQNQQLSSAQSVPSARPSSGIIPPNTPPDASDTQAWRQQGIQMTNRINEWIVLNSKDIPGPIKPDETPSEEEQARHHAFVDRLDSEWRSQFETEVNSLIKNLNVRGIIRACSSGAQSRFYDDPGQVLKIRKSCADRIQEAALR